MIELTSKHFYGGHRVNQRQPVTAILKLCTIFRNQNTRNHGVPKLHLEMKVLNVLMDYHGP
jgi:hypothetical protein